MKPNAILVFCASAATCAAANAAPRAYASAAIEASRLEDGSQWRDATLGYSVATDDGSVLSANLYHRSRGRETDDTLEVSGEMRVTDDIRIRASVAGAHHGRIAPHWQMEGGATVQIAPEVEGFAHVRRSATRFGPSHGAQAGVRWTHKLTSVSMSAVYASASAGQPHWGFAVTGETYVAPDTRVSLSYSDATDDIAPRVVRARTFHAQVARDFDTFSVTAGLTFEDRDGPDRVAASIGVTYRGDL